MRHLISAVYGRIAVAAIVAAPATPIPVTLIKSRRFIDFFLPRGVGQPSCRGLQAAWNIRFPIATMNYGHRDAKARPSREGRALLPKVYQPRVRERIMKL